VMLPSVFLLPRFGALRDQHQRHSGGDEPERLDNQKHVDHRLQGSEQSEQSKDLQQSPDSECGPGEPSGQQLRLVYYVPSGRSRAGAIRKTCCTALISASATRPVVTSFDAAA